MTVILNISNDKPFLKGTGMATKIIVEGVTQPIVIPSESSDVCYCDIECEYIEKVFHHEDGEDYQNDKSSFLYAKKRSSDAIIIKLFKNDIEIAILNNNTYGIYYPTFTLQPLYVGYQIDWSKVFDENGNGLYQIKTTANIFGSDIEYISQKFSLTRYSDLAANKTVKIETIQNGNVIGSQFDLTDLSWYSAFRVPGTFGLKEPTLEQNNYIDNNYTISQIQDKIITEYLLKTNYLPSVISNQVFYSKVLANFIYITNYDLTAHEIIRKIDVVPVSPEDINYQTKGRGVRFDYKFKPRIENNIKTNF